jgi:hypothetical protein
MMSHCAHFPTPIFLVQAILRFGLFMTFGWEIWYRKPILGSLWQPLRARFSSFQVQLFPHSLSPRQHPNFLIIYTSCNNIAICSPQPLAITRSLHQSWGSSWQVDRVSAHTQTPQQNATPKPENNTIYCPASAFRLSLWAADGTERRL